MNEEKIDFMGLAKLIAACARAGVQKLKCGAVEVDFNNDTMSLKEWPKMPKGMRVSGEGSEPVQMGEPQIDDSQMLLEDPLAYEKMQLEG